LGEAQVSELGRVQVALDVDHYLVQRDLLVFFVVEVQTFPVFVNPAQEIRKVPEQVHFSVVDEVIRVVPVRALNSQIIEFLYAALSP
jgi:hypothetical protein